MPKLGERPAPQHAQHARVRPFPPRATRPKLAFDEPSLAAQTQQHGLRRGRPEPVPRGEVGRGERRVRARVAQREVAQRIAHRLQQRVGDADRQRDADAVAEARRVFGRDESRVAGDAHVQRAPRGDQLLDARGHVDRDRPFGDLAARQVAERQQHVVHAVRALDLILRIEPLQLPLDRVHRLGVEQLAQLRVAKQLAQLRLIDRQGLRPALRQRCVAIVDEARHVAEEQRGGKRRRRFRVHRRDPHFPAPHVSQRADERGHIEDVAQALAIRFEQHGKRSVARRHRQQIRRALALLPQRRALPWTPAGEEQRARGVFAELRGEQRRAAELPHHQRLHFVGIRKRSRGSGGSSTSGNLTTNPSSPQSVSTSAPVSSRIFAATAIAHGACTRPPRGDRTQTRQSPSSSRTRSTTTVVASGSARVAAIWSRRYCSRFSAARASRSCSRVSRSRAAAGGTRIRSCIRRPIARPSSRGRPGRSPFQNGILPGSPGAGDTSTRSCVISSMRHDEAPSTNVSPTRLSNTISSSSSPTRGGARSGAEQKHAVQPAIRNRPAVGDRHALGAFARRQRAGDAVPGDARTQFREFVGRVASREHVEHALEDGATQLRKRRGAPDRAKQLVDLPVVHRGHRHDLLRDDVERVPGEARGLDRAIVHRLGDRRAGDEIAAKFREHDPFADRVRVVAAAADALKPAGHRWRRLDLHDEVDRAHVDAELQRGGRDEPAQLSGFQQILDLDALRARDGAVVRADERLAGELIQRAGQPFRQSAAVHEDERRSMRENQLEQSRVDGRPDRRPAIAERRRTAGDVIRRRQLRHVLDRHLDRQLQRFLLAGIDDGDGTVVHSARRGELVLHRRFRIADCGLTTLG